MFNNVVLAAWTATFCFPNQTNFRALHPIMTKWKVPDKTKVFKCIFPAGIIFKSCCTFLFLFAVVIIVKSTVPTLYVTELVVQLNCTHLLYLPRNSWSSRTVPIFCIGRRNHSQIVQYLCSLYLQESLLICTVTSLSAVKFTVKSNRKVPFFFIGSRNHSQIVLYLSALYSPREALSNCISNILHLPPPPTLLL